MAKKNFGIPDDVLLEIMKRDEKCVYCRKVMIYPYDRQNVCDSATIEHLSPHFPFRWSDGMKENNIAMCCHSCNSSRREKELVDWFKKPYCIDRNINENTVAEPVKNYLKRLETKKENE